MLFSTQHLIEVVQGVAKMTQEMVGDHKLTEVPPAFLFAVEDPQEPQGYAIVTIKDFPGFDENKHDFLFWSGVACRHALKKKPVAVFTVSESWMFLNPANGVSPREAPGSVEFVEFVEVMALTSQMMQASAIAFIERTNQGLVKPLAFELKKPRRAIDPGSLGAFFAGYNMDKGGPVANRHLVFQGNLTNKAILH